jgi:hypothetical protein
VSALHLDEVYGCVCVCVCVLKEGMCVCFTKRMCVLVSAYVCIHEFFDFSPGDFYVGPKNPK